MKNQTQQIDLGKSYYMKSCPECSRRLGRLVYKPYPEAFGTSVKREKQTHRGAQPWCLECRRQSWEDSKQKKKTKEHNRRNPPLPLLEGQT